MFPTTDFNFPQLGYIFWHHTGHSLLPSFPWLSTHSNTAREVAGHHEQQQAWQGKSDGKDLQRTITLMKGAIQKLQEEVKALGERLDHKSC